MESLDDKLICIDCKIMVGEDLTMEERTLLEALESSHSKDEVFSLSSLQQMDEFEEGKNDVWQKIRQGCQLPQEEEKPASTGIVRQLWLGFTNLRWPVKAAIILLIIFLKLSLATYFLVPARREKETVSVPAPVKVPLDDVVPGSYEATRTLEDGVTLTVDSATAVAILQVSVGKQYTHYLSDGTKVQLNAASALRYPLAFAGMERAVEISGEVYFEVTENKEKPFIVLHNDEKVQVLGTHFNIKSYKNEPTAVTLLEGSLKVVTARESALLKPDDQFVAGKGVHKLSDSALKATNGWTQGLFKYYNTDVKIIMGDIARWYGKKVVYKNPGEEATLVMGGVSKKLTLEQVLRIVGYTNSVECVLKGDDVIEVYIIPKKKIVTSNK